MCPSLKEDREQGPENTALNRGGGQEWVYSCEYMNPRVHSGIFYLLSSASFIHIEL